MQAFLVGSICSLAGMGLLSIFYRYMKFEWPSNYITATRSFGLIVNRSATRYLLFILGPVYLTSLLMATIAMREGSYGIPVATIIGLTHAARNHGYRLLKVARENWRNLYGPDSLLQWLLFFLVMLASVIGGLGPGPFDFVVPPLEEFFIAVWTAVFVALVGTIALERTRGIRRVNDLLGITLKEVPSSLVNYAEHRAEEAGTDVILALSILYAENLQRPPWFRRLERAKGKVFRRGSYGVMQVKAPHPISDEESIDLAVSQYLAGVTIPRNEHGVPELSALEDALRQYNDNPAFIELASGIYMHIQNQHYPYQW